LSHRLVGPASYTGLVLGHVALVAAVDHLLPGRRADALAVAVTKGIEEHAA
jgi:hypothetical protein